ncbi:MAG TPA: hypothetical protein VHC72_11985, partial [Bryobacteraceae bacterium]|nr:hypothetical protein [Bryobacteraceae bacterium]
MFTSFMGLSGYDTEVRDLKAFSRIRRSFLLLAPARLFSRRLPGQQSLPPAPDEPDDVRLPNGKRQQDEILKADYQKNLKDAQELVSLAQSFEDGLEKEDRFVLSLSSLKKL